MGLFQEATIIAGDLITQPIRAKIIEHQTGKKQKVTKVVTEGALIGDGGIDPEIKTSMDAMLKAINTRQTVVVQDFNVKQVTWIIESSE